MLESYLPTDMHELMSGASLVVAFFVMHVSGCLAAIPETLIGTTIQWIVPFTYSVARLDPRFAVLFNFMADLPR